MSKTTDLRKAVTTALNGVAFSGVTYYQIADVKAVFPYKVYSLSSVDLGDLARDDYTLTVDIWDRSLTMDRIEGIADSIETALNAANLPQTNVLPTFFRNSRTEITEDNKDIKHIQLEFLVQNYTR